MCLFDQSSSDLKMDLFGGHFLLYDELRCVRFSIGSQPISPGAVFRGMYIYKFNRIKKSPKGKISQLAEYDIN